MADEAPVVFKAIEAGTSEKRTATVLMYMRTVARRRGQTVYLPPATGHELSPAWSRRCARDHSLGIAADPGAFRGGGQISMTSRSLPTITSPA